MIKDKIEKMHRETCYIELKKASKLKGTETSDEIVDIYAKCLDIQGIINFNNIIKH